MVPGAITCIAAMPLPQRLPRPELGRDITPGQPAPIPVDDPLHNSPRVAKRPPTTPVRRGQERGQTGPLSVGQDSSTRHRSSIAHPARPVWETRPRRDAQARWSRSCDDTIGSVDRRRPPWCGVELSRNRSATREAFVSHAPHANAALIPRARLRLARLAVDEGWSPARDAEHCDVFWRPAASGAVRLSGPACCTPSSTTTPGSPTSRPTTTRPGRPRPRSCATPWPGRSRSSTTPSQRASQPCRPGCTSTTSTASTPRSARPHPPPG